MGSTSSVRYRGSQGTLQCSVVGRILRRVLRSLGLSAGRQEKMGTFLTLVSFLESQTSVRLNLHFPSQRVNIILTSRIGRLHVK